MLIVIASDLDSEEVVNFAKIGDQELFCELPLKPHNFIDRVTDETEIIDMGENDGEATVMQLNENTGISCTGFEAEFE